MIQVKFLVPTHEDDDFGGQLHTSDKWSKIEKELYAMFEGWTLSPGLYSGAYTDPDSGEMVCDESKQYTIAIEQSRVSELKKYLGKVVAPLFKQKQIYFFDGTNVEFIKST